MRNTLSIWACIAVLAAGSSATYAASDLQTMLDDFNLPPTPGPGGGTSVLFHDLVGYNTEIALQAYGVPKPHVPSATIQIGDEIVRAFSQAPGSNSGVTGFDPVLFKGPDNNNNGVGFRRFNLDQNPSDWFGLQFDNGNVDGVMTVSDLIAQVGSGHFGYAFDQNQTNSGNQYSADVLPSAWENGNGDADGTKLRYLDDGIVMTDANTYAPELGGDMWLKGRVILIHPDQIAALNGLDAATVQSTVVGLSEGTQKMTFLFDDTVFKDYPEDAEFYAGPYSVPNDLSRDWVHLPGTSYVDLTDLDTTQFGPGVGITGINNNGDSARADWAGFLVDDLGEPIDYNDYASWGYLLEVQGLYDEASKEEVYIFNLGSPTPPPPFIPEPLTLLAFAGAVGSLGGYVRRRRA